MDKFSNKLRRKIIITFKDSAETTKMFSYDSMYTADGFLVLRVDKEPKFEGSYNDIIELDSIASFETIIPKELQVK